MKQILSFGAGVQSTALLLMSCRGLLPKIDVAIFADVGWEPEAVYQHLEWCKVEAAKHGIEVVTVSKKGSKGLRSDIIDNISRKDGLRFAAMPFFVKHEDGTVALGRRQCTNEYKIQPIEKYLRYELLGLKPKQRAPKEVVFKIWMGISFDEAPRAKPSIDKYKEHVFPFLNWGMDSPDGKTWRRYQIIKWLEDNYPEITVPRSACLGCPFHDNEEWRNVKENQKEWEDVCEFDETIRKDQRNKIKLPMYLHRSCLPIKDVDLRTEGDKGQGSLWDNECEGMCGM